jgi:hypothetical protein
MAHHPDRPKQGPAVTDRRRRRRQGLPGLEAAAPGRRRPGRPAARRSAHRGDDHAHHGVPARVVMQVLGHSQISLTLGTYSHVAPELAAEAAERVGRCHWHTHWHTDQLQNDHETGKAAGQRPEGVEPPRVSCFTTQLTPVSRHR